MKVLRDNDKGVVVLARSIPSPFLFTCSAGAGGGLQGDCYCVWCAGGAPRRSGTFLTCGEDICFCLLADPWEFQKDLQPNP